MILEARGSGTGDMNIRKLLWLSLAPLLTSCVSFQPYSPTTLNLATATVQAVRDEAEGAPLGTKPAHWFFGYDNPSCLLNERGGFLGSISWDVGSQFRATILAERPIYIRMVTRSADLGGPGTIVRTVCISVASFTPRSGATYRVSQNGTAADCPAWVIDEATGSPPADFSLQRVLGPCAEFNGLNDGATADAPPKVALRSDP